jgi:hypothetical protein
MQFSRCVQQGSVLCPTLFNVFLNPLLCLFTVIGQQRGVSHGIKGIAAFNNLAFADDLTIVTEIRRLGVPSGGAQLLLNAIEEFSKCSGMELKIVTSGKRKEGVGTSVSAHIGAEAPDVWCARTRSSHWWSSQSGTVVPARFRRRIRPPAPRGASGKRKEGLGPSVSVHIGAEAPGCVVRPHVIPFSP